MYGFIHCCLEDLVVNKFGEETWKQILQKSGVKLRGASFLMHKIYEDQITLKLIVTTTEVVGLDLETCLEAFGKHFLEYCQNNGYDQILRVLGSNLPDFLTNLDNLHDHLGSTYPGMRAPSFRVTTAEDGILHLHYYSERKGLSAIVRGLVTAVSKEFFDTEVDVKTLPCTENSDHEILEVRRKVAPNSQDSQEFGTLFPLTSQSEFVNISVNPADSLVNARLFCAAFPFHVMFDEHFKIIEIGNSLLRIIRKKWTRKTTFADIFQVIRPVIESTYQSILDYQNQVFVVKMRDNYLDCGTNKVALRFKGQMIPVIESNAILFLCSPRVSDLCELSTVGLYLSDFPIHDRTRELLLMVHGRKGERELVEKLDEATNHLRILDSKLREENKKTEEILQNIFPSKIATLLCQNVTVLPEQFAPVTCLFSDIVGFTAMCSDPSLVPMDIVHLLNKLYSQFDNLSHLLGVYKVETIGDAYVVVGGLPEYVSDHADRVVAMGLGMLRITQTVTSPVDGKPIRMRIGIHSGAVMAGIVGIQMPRYCLFGNTVTLANKMESTSRPGEVHISDDALKYLTGDGYSLNENTADTGFAFKTYFVTNDRLDIDGRLKESDTLIVNDSSAITRSTPSSPYCSNVLSLDAISDKSSPAKQSKSLLVCPMAQRTSFLRRNSDRSTSDNGSKTNIDKICADFGVKRESSDDNRLLTIQNEFNENTAKNQISKCNLNINNKNASNISLLPETTQAKQKDCKHNSNRSKFMQRLLSLFVCFKMGKKQPKNVGFAARVKPTQHLQRKNEFINNRRERKVIEY